MADSPDVVLLATGKRRWSFPGGDEDETSITLYVGTSALDRTIASRGFEVRLPLDVDEHGLLQVGEPEVTEVER